MLSRQLNECQPLRGGGYGGGGGYGNGYGYGGPPPPGPMEVSNTAALAEAGPVHPFPLQICIDTVSRVDGGTRLSPWPPSPRS
jgi:hypothetical protein